MTGRLVRAVLAVAVTASSPAAADAAAVAYVDEVAVVAGPDAGAGRELARSVVERAGLRATFAAEGTSPCGEDAQCLAARARAAGAPVAIRVTIVAIADELVVSMLVVDTRREGMHRHVEENADLEGTEVPLATALAAVLAETSDRPRTRLTRAWIVAASAVALGIGGGLATWHAYDLRDQFVDQHVDDNGDVVGISPEDAHRAEATAQRWSLAGSLLLVGAAATGITATVLFVRQPGGETRPAGVVLGGRF